MEINATGLGATILGALGAGGVGVKLIDWARSRSERSAEVVKHANEKSAEIAIREIDADLTINERLLKRVTDIEARMDRQTLEHRHEIAECEKRSARIEAEYVAREKRERELQDANRLILYSYDTLRGDMKLLRKHVDRVEEDNRLLRIEVQKKISGTNIPAVVDEKKEG